jgi:hypothetical protein
MNRNEAPSILTIFIIGLIDLIIIGMMIIAGTLIQINL